MRLRAVAGIAQPFIMAELKLLLPQGVTGPDGGGDGEGGQKGLSWLLWHLAFDGCPSVSFRAAAHAHRSRIAAQCASRYALAAAATGQLQYGAALAHKRNCLEARRALLPNRRRGARARRWPWLRACAAGARSSASCMTKRRGARGPRRRPRASSSSRRVFPSRVRERSRAVARRSTRRRSRKMPALSRLPSSCTIALRGVKSSLRAGARCRARVCAGPRAAQRDRRARRAVGAAASVAQKARGPARARAAKTASR